MVDATAMSSPVTHGELREEIERLETRFDQLETCFDQLETRFDQLETRFDQLETRFDRFEIRLDQKLEKLEQKFDQKLEHTATKADLEIWGGALHMAMKTNFEILGGTLFEHLQTELARHVKAVQESLPIQVSAIDDKYADLPARVSHLEIAVFVPKAR